MLRIIRKKAQSSVEYLSIVGIALLLLLPATVIFRDYAKGTKDEVISNQINLIGNTIMNKAEEMFVLGAGSWTTIDVTIPDAVSSVSIINNSDLVVNYTTSKGLSNAVFFSYRFSINNGSNCPNACDLGITPGMNKIRVEYVAGDVVIRKVT